MTWTGTTVEVAARVAAIDYANCPNNEIDIPRVVVALETVGDGIARKDMPVFIPTILGDPGLGTVFHILLTTGHEPRRSNTNELRIVVRHGNQSFKVGPLPRKTALKASKRRRLAGRHRDNDCGSQDNEDPAYRHEETTRHDATTGVQTSRSQDADAGS